MDVKGYFSNIWDAATGKKAETSGTKAVDNFTAQTGGEITQGQLLSYKEKVHNYVNTVKDSFGNPYKLPPIGNAQVKFALESGITIENWVKDNQPLGKETNKTIGTSDTAPIYSWIVPSTKMPEHNFNDFGKPRTGHTHQGTDVFAQKGTNALAAIAGTIYKTNNKDTGLGGKSVWIKGNDGKLYYYAHLDTIAVEAGQQVTSGFAIGTVGNSGNAKGGAAHIHFEIHDQSAGGGIGTVVKPAKWYKSISSQLGYVTPDQSFVSYPGVLDQATTRVGGNPLDLKSTVINYQRVAGGRGVSVEEGEAQWAIAQGMTALEAADYFNTNVLSKADKETDQRRRHQFETDLIDTYREYLGVTPTQQALDHHMKQYDQTNGINYNADDVKNFVVNSVQYRSKIANEVSPQLIKLYQDALGIEDITKIPKTYDYLINKIKSGEWKYANAEAFVLTSAQAKQRRYSLLADELDTHLQQMIGSGKLTDLQKNKLMPLKNMGWSDAQIESYLRKQPDFSKRYPGIKDYETADEYNTKVETLNEAWWKYKGRSFDPHSNPNDLSVLDRVGAA